MPWLILTSYRRNRRKYLFVILSLILVTLLSTLSIGGLDLAAATYKRPLLMYGGGHVVLWPSEPEEDSYLFYPNRVFEIDKAAEIVNRVFPEATLTPTLVVPATYIDTSGRAIGMSYMRHIAGRSDDLESWYLFPDTRRGLSLAEIPADEPTVVCATSHGLGVGADVALPGALLRVAKYAGTDYPWSMDDVEVQAYRVAGLHGGSHYRVYMRLEALRALTGCPDNVVSMLGIAFPGIQYKVNADKVQLLRELLSEADLDLVVAVMEDMGKGLISGVEFLEDGSRRYLPIIYGVTFTAVAAIMASIAQSRRRELHMLHVIGLNRRQVRTLFAAESTIASAFAGLIGYGPIVLVARFALCTTGISTLPFIITLVGAAAISVGISTSILGGESQEN